LECAGKSSSSFALPAKGSIQRKSDQPIPSYGSIKPRQSTKPSEIRAVDSQEKAAKPELVGGCAYFLLPLNLFVVMAIASAASFYAHVFFDKEYHVEGSWLQRFAWFRRQQELYFVHHRHANSNFGVIHFFWDKILGTYRRPDAAA
jgi:sterol desaturase/sphingolipid hydroxylase (fatty acid hydroxylase superfamily)